MKCKIAKSVLSGLMFAALHGVGASASAQHTPPPARNGHDLLIAIDVTGSMGSRACFPSGAPGTAFDVAKAAALGWLASQPTSNAGTPGVTTPTPTRVSVWKFQNDGYVNVQPLTENFLTAASAIGSLTDAPSGDTPLAMTMCDLTEQMREDSYIDANGDGLYQPNETDLLRRKHLYFATDGHENNTPGYYASDPLPHHRCGGPDTEPSSVYPDYTINSWQWKVRNMLLTGDPTSPAAHELNDGVIFDVDYIFASFVAACPASASQRMAMAGAAGAHAISSFRPSTKQLMVQNDRAIFEAESKFMTPAKRLVATRAFAATPAALPTERDQDFFDGLATELNGTMTVLSPDPATGTFDLQALAAPAGRVPGDVDYNGCVNDADATALFEVYGQNANSSIAADQADVDESGVVDYDDYTMVLQNYARGPNC